MTADFVPYIPPRVFEHDRYLKKGELVTCPHCGLPSLSEMWAYDQERRCHCPSNSCSEPDRQCPLCGGLMWHGAYDPRWPEAVPS